MSALVKIFSCGKKWNFPGKIPQHGHVQCLKVIKIQQVRPVDKELANNGALYLLQKITKLSTSP